MDEPVFELTTKIPKDKLVYTICNFYRTMSHKKIRLARETADDIIFEDYDPLVKIDNVYGISKISVHTYKKKENKHVFFDSVNITFADEGATTKIMWYVGLGFKRWHLLGLVYLLIVFLASTYFAWIICPADSPWHRYCFTLAFPSFLFLFIWPMYYIIFKRKGKKLNSHPDTQKYRKDFEEFIRKKEKELLSERY
ncbi:hypothetical protein [Methanolobus sp. WCC5]|uniref:hypothetical protein n=1 Tax=Methanolobus sp. WCC5 TaxID=3125785 RepID=UPI003250F4E3